VVPGGLYGHPPRFIAGLGVGIQPHGLEVFAPNGRAFTFPAWSFDRVLMPLVVRWGIYRGVRDNEPSR
jgi:apoptosis-inducing factor 2